MKYIPIIGTISAGKTTFLRAFLGIDILHVGSITTTKFVCLIKNSMKTSFYHAIPKKEKELVFDMEGKEINNEEEIRQKMIEINANLKEKKGTINDIFYILEIPIKNVENVPLLENCYFMDIPGLNENETTYIKDIFSLITIKDILFEIFIFDSTSIGSDNVLNIFTSLEERKCLCKTKNIYILNKIDQCTSGDNEETIVEGFKKYFYETFEDEKIKNKVVDLNIYENYFIPMNSILYRAETKILEDFSSLLIFEFFIFLKFESHSENSTFAEYIKNRVNAIIERDNIDIEKDIKKINIEEFKISAEKSINNLKNIAKSIKNSDNIQLGLNLSKKSVEKDLKKLYSIQKIKKYFVFHSESYIKLQEVIKNIQVNKVNDDLSSPPPLMSQNKNIIINKDNKIISQNETIKTIEKLDSFLKEIFKEIDPENELKEFKISLQTLRENILGRKLRISFIGNISVGKSSVLNCIIGYQILPTKDTECTYRGVILRHSEDKEFKLYRTKLITRGNGLDKYYYFLDESKYHCKGIPAIKDYLNNKNNDKFMRDDDAFIVITGKLKIFNYINLDKDIINKIEFIDLPGPDRKNNTFNDQKYYEKILKFSNCCIYINEPKTIEDKNSVKRMLEQYSSDKSKVFSNIRKNFIKTCLFLINKSDNIEEGNEKIKKDIKNSLFKIIQKEEKDLKAEEMNISFFSSKYFLYYLEIETQYIIALEEYPLTLLEELYKGWDKAFTIKNFKSYINKKIEGIQEKFEFDTEEEFEPDNNFIKRLNLAFDKLFEGKYRGGTSMDDQEEIIIKLFTFYKQFKNANFNYTNYSHTFFDDLKEVILFCKKFHDDNLKYSILEFFTYTDQLFDKEIKKESEIEKLTNTKRYELFQNEIIPSINKKFEEKQKEISDIYELGLYRVQAIIDEEIKNAESILKEANNDINFVAKKFEEKIDAPIQELNKKKENELNKLSKEIEEILNERIDSFISKNKNDSTKVDINKGITLKMFLSAVGSAVSGVAVRSGLVFVGNSLLATAATAAAAAAATGTITTTATAIGTALTGPVGIAIGFGVGIAISAISMLVHYFSKSKRYITGLLQTKIDISKKFEEIKDMFNNDFSSFKESLLNELKIKVEIMKKQLNSVNKEKWAILKQKYSEEKKTIEESIKLYK